MHQRCSPSINNTCDRNQRVLGCGHRSRMTDFRWPDPLENARGATMRAVAGMFGRLAVAVAAVASVAVAGAAPASSGVDRAGPPAAARAALAAHQPGLARTAAPGRKLPAGIRQACDAPAGPGRMSCFALIRSAVHASAHPTTVRPTLVTPGAYNPADLQSAYSLATASAGGGQGQTVAVVDAFDDPNAPADLATYRQQWGLAACDTATGAGCVTKVN